MVGGNLFQIVRAMGVQANEVQELRQVKIDTQAALRAVSDPPLPTNIEGTLDPAEARTPFLFSPSTVDRRVCPLFLLPVTPISL